MYSQLIVEKDVPIKVRDGALLCADVFRPGGADTFPAIMTLGPYPKDIQFKAWSRMRPAGIDVDGPFMHWETVDPEWWVPQGYAVVRVDGRGTGKSPGTAHNLTMGEAEDYYDAVEWAGTQKWSNGKVAVMGVSYFAMNAWRVAALNPPHLAAIIPWEGAFDLYRDVNRHGGIRSNTFTQGWAANVARHTQEPTRQVPYPELYDERVARNNPDLADIKVRLLSAGNWAGVGLHLRGNIEGYLGAGSRQKFLRVHSGDHVTPFYSLEGRLYQLRFLEQWLRGIDTGILREPPVRLAIRRGGDDYEWRYEYEWPLARTRWTPYYLDARDATLSVSKIDRVSYVSYKGGLGEQGAGVNFTTPTFGEDTEVTGPIKLKLWVSSSVDDADLFVILHHMDASDKEIRYPGAMQNIIAAAYGWLRVSHRKLDPARSTPYRPFHTNDQLQKVKPGEVVPVEVEIWPSSMVLRKGQYLTLQIAANDDPGMASYSHTDPADRIASGATTIHTGGAYDSHLLLPVIPRRV